MKAIIEYYSYSGNNELLARELKSKLNCDVEKIVEKKRRNGMTILLDVMFNRDSKVELPKYLLNEYDMVIFVAPVWNGKIATPLKSFIKLEKDHVKNYAFVSICSGQKGQNKKLTDQLAEVAQHEPAVVTELKVNSLLPPEMRNKIRYTTPYRVSKQDFNIFEKDIQKCLEAVMHY